MNKTKILFVCLGNICRSPMAEYIAKDYIKEMNIKDVEVDSAGTANYHQGEFMHKGTDWVLKNLNIEHKSFKSKQISQSIFDNSDFVLVMDNSNYKGIINMFGKNDKVIKITEFCSLNYNEVPDPWYTGDFEQTYKILKNSIINFFELKINK